MALRIKVNSGEFNAACTNGCVYGELRGKSGLYVYAELGMEKEYIPTANDTPRTEYRMFVGCDVFFAKTREHLANGEFVAEELPNGAVIIYC